MILRGDVTLQAPSLDPADASSATTRDPFFITIDFASESTEFVGDSNTAVTLTKVEVDGVDVLADVSTEDDILFLLAITGITSAEHVLTVNGTDGAGNALSADASSTFTVTDRAKFSISLQPGWSLISLPSDPESPAINDVFADLPGVSDVVAYDPTVPGGTLSASRDEAGTLVGTLETIDSRKGYWVNAAKFKALEVSLKVLQAGQVATLPPAITIVEGWNLIPVVDITGTKVSGDSIEGEAYLASILASVSRVYTFDTIRNEWDLVDIDGTITGTDEDLQFGKGYFVYSTSKGVLVP